MWRHTIKTLLEHKLRLVLTGVAIVLGVAMVTATLIAATALDRALDETYRADAIDADMVVRTVPNDRTGVMPPIPEDVVERIAGIEGVGRATGAISGYAQLLGSNGEALGQGGSDLANPPEGRSLDWSVESRLVVGRLPSGPDEAAVDRANAEQEGFAIGDEVRIVGSTGLPQTFLVAAIIDMPERRGEPTVGFDLATARAVLGRPAGEFDTVNVEVVDGTDPAAVADEVAATAGHGYEVISAADLADEQASDPRDDLDYFTALLLVSSAVALVVGGLIIRNTLSMLVAQRTHEIALLRCIGASPRQIRRSVVIEAAVVGAVASVGGMLLGVVLAGVMRSAFESLETFRDLPTPALSVTPWIVAVALGGGIVATVLFALSPARRATRVAPVAALRDDPADPSQQESRRRRLISTVIAVVAVLAVSGGVTNRSGMLVGVGAVATLIVLDAVGAWLARPVARLIGVPLAMAVGLPGRLARRNATRNPRRTATTATALTIGVGLSTFLAVWAESQKETDHSTFDAEFHADYRVDVPSTDFHGPISQAAADRLAALPELTAVTAFGTPIGRSVTAADPQTLATLIGDDVTAGDLGEVGPGTIAVSVDVAAERELAVGSTVEVELVETDSQDQFRVVAVFDSYMLGEGLIEYAEAANRSLPVGYILSPQEFERLGGPPTIGWIYGRVADGVSLNQADAAIEGVLADYPSARLQDRTELRIQGDAGVDAGLQVFYGIFGLIVVIALFGIVNTLTLSIVERVREVGLLRAIGLDPGDVRSMVRAESMIIATLATIIGITLGIIFVWAMLSTSSPGSDLDLDLSIPVGQLALIAAAAVAAAVAVAVPPSIHASRVDVLRAITTE